MAISRGSTSTKSAVAKASTPQAVAYTGFSQANSVTTAYLYGNVTSWGGASVPPNDTLITHVTAWGWTVNALILLRIGYGSDPVAVASPAGSCFDSAGNFYFTDNNRHIVRKFTKTGLTTTLAGADGFGNTNDGTGTAASFSTPQGITCDAQDNLYVTDQGSHRIRKITPAGVVTTFAGSSSGYSDNATGTSAQFNQPWGIEYDAFNNCLYVADYGNVRIRKITMAGAVSTVAGSGSSAYQDGSGSGASFTAVRGLTTDPATGNIYVADALRVRQVTPAGAVTSPIIGFGGVAYDCAWDGVAQRLYVADNGAFNVYTCNVSSGAFSVMWGQGAQGRNDGYSFTSGGSNTATLYAPFSLAITPDRSYIYLCDGTVRIRALPINQNLPSYTVIGHNGNQSTTNGQAFVPMVDVAFGGQTTATGMSEPVVLPASLRIPAGLRPAFQVATSTTTATAVNVAFGQQNTSALE